MSNLRRPFLLAIVILLSFTFGVMNNCGILKSGGLDKNSTIGGNPILTEIVSDPFSSSSEGPITICLTGLNLYSFDGKFEQIFVPNPTEITITANGSAITSIAIPQDSYQSLTLILENSCGTGRSFQVINSNGTTEVSTPLQIYFFATVMIDELRTKIYLRMSSVISALGAVSLPPQVGQTLTNVRGRAVTLNTWTPLQQVPTARLWHQSIWTGNQGNVSNRMYIWGGCSGSSAIGICDLGLPLNSGAYFDTNQNGWIAMPDTGAPVGRYEFSMVWADPTILIWGGKNGITPLGTGAKFHPRTNTWAPITDVGAPSPRATSMQIWTGTEMIIWGGFDGISYLNTGGLYNPVADSWTPMTTTNAPTGRHYFSAVWTGTEMIVWGGFDGTTHVNTGGRYTATGWTPTAVAGAPSPRKGHAAIWTGTEMIIWGGTDGLDMFNNGARYNPTNDTWSPMTNINAPNVRSNFVSVWTGQEMLIVGGIVTPLLADGFKYNPQTDTWKAISTKDIPSARYGSSGVWTGSELFYWGGWDLTGGAATDTGGRYTP